LTPKFTLIVFHSALHISRCKLEDVAPVQIMSTLKIILPEISPIL